MLAKPRAKLEPVPSVTLELFGRAQLLAHARRVTVNASTLLEALQQLAAQHPELVGPVLNPDGRPSPAYAINLGGQQFVTDLSRAISEDEEILLISSLSGG